MVQWLAAQAERRAEKSSPAMEDVSPTAAAAAVASAAAASQAAAAAASQRRMLLPHRPRSPQSSSLMDMAATVAAMSAAANAAAASTAMIRELRLAQQGKARMPFDFFGDIGKDGSSVPTTRFQCSKTSPPLVQGTTLAPALEEIQISTPNTSPIGSFSVPQPVDVCRVAVAFGVSNQAFHEEGLELSDELEGEDTDRRELQELRAGIADLECFVVGEERSGQCSDRARFALDLAVRGLTALESCAELLANADSLEEC